TGAPSRANGATPAEWTLLARASPRSCSMWRSSVSAMIERLVLAWQTKRTFMKRLPVYGYRRPQDNPGVFAGSQCPVVVFWSQPSCKHVVRGLSLDLAELGLEGLADCRRIPPAAALDLRRRVPILHDPNRAPPDA